MKKSIFAMAAMALVLASCDSNSGDSYQNLPFPECNLIIDNSNPAIPAQVSQGNYQVKYNFAKYCADVKTSELIINNNKYSFETDTMAVRPSKSMSITLNGEQQKVNDLLFSKAGSTSIGSAASDLSGAFVYTYMPYGTTITDITDMQVLNPSYYVVIGQRLDLRYTFMVHDTDYTVQTFWPQSFFLGQNTASSSSGAFTTKDTHYLIQINFDKQMGTVFVYQPKFSADQEETFPKMICLQNIPVSYTHDGFALKASEPTTKILQTIDGKTQLVSSERFHATDFSFVLTSKDLTETQINYSIDGKNISFKGCSIVKEGYN